MTEFSLRLLFLLTVFPKWRLEIFFIVSMLRTPTMEVILKLFLTVEQEVFFSNLSFSFLNNYLYLQVGLLGSACGDVRQLILQVTQYEKREKLVSILVRMFYQLFVLSRI
jgi:hypothetical protein